jgi:CheY-like chemotaxis protein
MKFKPAEDLSMNKMGHTKRILVVDDEPDVIETLKDLLEDDEVDSALNFEEARQYLEKETYDIAILDIRGVDGYALLEIAKRRQIPALMLTANALSPQDLVHSLKEGADAYIPKERISDIPVFIEDILSARKKGEKGPGKWFERLEAFFDRKFGEYWKEKSDSRFWNQYL